MTQVLLNVFSVLVAIAMVVLILLQRGSGAAAGSGFGGGASATVFGSRGSASFLTRATAGLAATFFILTMGHAMYVNRMDVQSGVQSGVGVMDAVETPAAPPSPAPMLEVPVSGDSAAPVQQDAELPRTAPIEESEVPSAPPAEEDPRS